MVGRNLLSEVVNDNGDFRLVEATDQKDIWSKDVRCHMMGVSAFSSLLAVFTSVLTSVWPVTFTAHQAGDAQHQQPITAQELSGWNCLEQPHDLSLTAYKSPAFDTHVFVVPV